MRFKTLFGLGINLIYNRHVLFKPYREVNIYIPELKVIYIGISKTGISSMKSLFLEKLGEDFDHEEYNSIHMKGHEVFTYIPNKEIITNDSFKFSFVRNPFDRLVSCYKNKILKEDYLPIQRGYGKLFYKNMPFDEFVQSVCLIPDLFADRHFRSQYSYLYENETLIVDFIGKFENIKNDFRVIQKKYDLAELPHINKSPGTKSYPDYYTEELVDLVYKRYKDDIEKFDYNKELKELRDHVKKSQS